ncbi:MAG: response regulator [Proteobacteria bacterium]|nr:response regulator [Pseudomonadota bacterium]
MIYPDTIKILIADNSRENQIALKSVLDKPDYEVITAHSGKKAIDLSKHYDFALILLDIELPGMEGFITAEKLKARKKTQHVPLIFISPKALEKDDLFKGYQAGAVDYIILPADPVVIKTKVNVFVNLFRLRQESEKRAAERLKSSETKYKSLFDTSRDGIAFMSLAGHIENANKAYCDMLGYSLNDLIFMTDKQNTPEKWLERDREILEDHVLKRDYSEEYRKELIRKDSTVFPVMVRIWLVRDDKGEPLRLLKLVRDVTDQSRLETQLRQAQKMESIGTLAGGIAHDFNNILGAIIGYSQLARYNIKDNEQALHDIDHVLTASNRAKDLVKHILGFSRLTEHSMQPIQLHHIVKEALKLIRASLPSTIEIKQNITSYKTSILADPTEIHQVIMNFCTNALHAMEITGGVLEVTLEPVEGDHVDFNEHPGLKPGPHLKLVVSDTGCGIDPRDIERIFDPYFTTKKMGTGTGLGLSVVHGIIKTHGGSIHVWSQPGQGTVMTVMLPRLQSTIEKAASGPEMLPLGHESLLFVDDEKSLVEIEKVMLQRLGYRVVSESSSLTAFNTFKKNPDHFDMVITDMTMPEMTGLELAREITAIKPDIPIILCTGYNKRITEAKAKEAGISLLLLKPVEIKELAVSIRRLFDTPYNQRKKIEPLGRKKDPSLPDSTDK